MPSVYFLSAIEFSQLFAFYQFINLEWPANLSKIGSQIAEILRLDILDPKWSLQFLKIHFDEKPQNLV